MTKKPVDWGAVHRVRSGEVTTVLNDRYGRHGFIIPDDDAGDKDLFALLCVKAQCYRPDRREKAVLDAIALWAPWMSADKARETADRAIVERKITGDKIGQWLLLDADTRDRLRVWRIGAFDLDEEGRKQRRRERRQQQDRKRKAGQRRKTGAPSRAEWLKANNKQRAQPWLEMGISRASYYRRQAKGRETGETGCSATPTKNETGCSADVPANHADGPVSREGARKSQEEEEEDDQLGRSYAGKADGPVSLTPTGKRTHPVSGHKAACTHDEYKPINKHQRSE